MVIDVMDLAKTEFTDEEQGVNLKQFSNFQTIKSSKVATKDY